MSELIASPVIPGHQVFPSAAAWIRLITPSVGVFLIAAALMKALSPADSVVTEAVYDVPAWIMAAGVQIELAVGLWLVSGWRPRAAREAAIVLFLAFAAFSLYRSLAGYESCGCFGSLRVNPWLTFVLDLGVLGMLAFSRRHANELPVAPNSGARAWTYGIAWALVAAVMLILIGLRPGTTTSTHANEPGITVTDSMVILEPEQWIGRAFPLVKELSPAVDLQHGKWILLFFHHDCPQCQEAMPQYEALAAELNEVGDAMRVLLIEVPPFGPGPMERQSISAVRLSDKHDWFVQTPLEVVLGDGKVVTASVELPAIADLP